MENLVSWNNIKAKTASVGTGIFVTTEPQNGYRVIIPRVSVRCGDTAESLICGTVKDTTTISGNYGIGATVITALTNVGFMADDKICVKSIDTGNYYWLDVLSRVINGDGTVDLTVPAITAPLNNGSIIYWFSGVADSEHERFPMEADASYALEATDGFFGSPMMGAPMFFYIPNSGGTPAYFLGATVLEINK